jgi:hypothetical protein
MDWISIETQKPKVGEWVLIWDVDTKIPAMGKWTGAVWRCCFGNMSTKRARYWTRVRGPENQGNEQQYKSAMYTKRESQNA